MNSFKPYDKISKLPAKAFLNDIQNLRRNFLDCLNMPTVENVFKKVELFTENEDIFDIFTELYFAIIADIAANENIVIKFKI